MYCKDNILYPVALSKQQDHVVQMTATMIGPLSIIKDKPQGEAINLLDKPTDSNQ